MERISRPAPGRRVAAAVLLAGLAVGLLAGPARAADPAAGLPAALYRDLGLSRPVQAFEAPGFALPDLAGRSVRLADLAGQAVLLYFWTTW